MPTATASNTSKVSYLASVKQVHAGWDTTVQGDLQHD
jgi:hypothetical protein